MYLPFPASEYQLKSFWLVMSLGIGLVAGSLFSLFLSSGLFLLGIFVALGLALPGFIRPQIATIPYRAFNKVVRVSAGYANEWILAVCYFVISIAGGKDGSFLHLGRLAEPSSLWMPIKEDSSRVYSMKDGATISIFSKKYWFFSFLKWAIKSGNWWMCSLIPFMILIAIFKKETITTAVPSNIYTLY